MKALTELLSQGSSNVYWDRKTFASIEDQLAASKKSATVYVGNLGFEVSEDLIYAHFAQAGSIKRVIMGINKNTKQPCGFCFVEYDDIESSRDAVTLLNASKMGDGRVVRVELDPGFRPGRQFGRGTGGGQVRDERRQRHNPQAFDAGRGVAGGGMDGALGSNRGGGGGGGGHYGPGGGGRGRGGGFEFVPPPAKEEKVGEKRGRSEEETGGDEDGGGGGDDEQASKRFRED